MHSSFVFQALLLGLCAMSVVAAPLAGGVSSADKDDQYVKEAAQVAVAKLNQGEQQQLKGTLGIEGQLQLVHIKSATSQVVAGSLYKMVITVQDGAGKSHDIAVSVWSRPWLQRSNDAEERKQAWILNSAEAAHS